MFGRTLIFIFIVLMCTIWGLNEISRSYFAYTGDAYVLSDYVTLSPTVAGNLARLHVDDNDEVEAGDVLFEIDARPYALQHEAAQAALDRARSSLKSSQDSLRIAKERVVASQATLKDTRDTQERLRKLQAQAVVTEQRLEDINRDLSTAVADFGAQKAGVVVASDAVTAARANVASAEAALGEAVYNLEQTKIKAPFSGFVAPFTDRQGAYLSVGSPVMAVVDDNAWRIVANLPEAHLSHVSPGQPVWLTVASKPWTLLKGTVLSVPRGISRSATPADPLPYVAPTISWIRLSRRFPVEIAFDNAGEIPLFMGANARVFIRHVSAEAKNVDPGATPDTDPASGREQ
ncbi:MAG: HlyD family secretion protein [Stappiaceae bacterium]